MKIGVPKEIKRHEYRVGLVPESVKALVAQGHEVLVQSSAGDGISVSDQAYIEAGAKVVSKADQIFADSELIIKVKEPQPEECKQLRSEQIIFTFLHLAADLIQTQLLLASGAVAIAYETVTDQQGRLPILAPMSVIAGRIAVQMGATCLEKPKGGIGILLGGAPGVKPAKVLVIGAGSVGTNAAHVARGMGAEVIVLDKESTVDEIADHVKSSDLVVGAVLVPGALSPQVVSRKTIAGMKPGTVVVDVSIDQGGCFETSKPTTFDEPTYVESGVIHQCITNLPGAVPRTSTFALNNATLPFIVELANKGYKKACLENPHLLEGLNICRGNITHPSVAKAFVYDYVSALECLRSV